MCAGDGYGYGHCEVDAVCLIGAFCEMLVCNLGAVGTDVCSIEMGFCRGMGYEVMLER